MWSHTLHDLQVLVKLNSQQEMARTYQDYETLTIVVAQALGGKTSRSSSPHSTDGSVGSYAELAKAFVNFGTVSSG